MRWDNRYVHKGHYFVYDQKTFKLYSKGFSYNLVYYAPRQKYVFIYLCNNYIHI